VTDTWEALFARRTLGVRLGLEIVEGAYAAMGRPAQGIPAIHVVGTNGKGSTAALAEHALRGRGLRTGLYTSPHLHRVGERVRVGGQPVDDERLRAHVEAVLRVEGGLSLPRPLSFFELLTLAAFDLLAAAGVDAMVVEAGLGGRLDATRLIEPRVVAVTSIDFDHMAILGDTIAKITTEKAAVMRPGVPTVSAPQRPEAEAVLRAVQARPVDVLVLDIQMPGLTGLELHALLPAPAPYVIFATAHPEHAVQAFELGAVDYVLKPIEAGRLGKAIERARTVVEARRGSARAEVERAAASEPEVVLPRLPVSTREGVVLLDPATLSHAVFDGVLVTLVTRDGRQHLTDASLQDIAARLPADRFVRAHRRALLNLHEVAILRPTDSGGYLAVTHAGQEVPVSRQTARKLRRALGL